MSFKCEGELHCAKSKSVSVTVNFAEFNDFTKRYKDEQGKMRADIGGNMTNITNVKELTQVAKKQANDALYEAREGRKKTEAQIAETFNKLKNGFQELISNITNQNVELASRTDEARQLGNDALYETRANRQKLQSEANQMFASVRTIANDALYEARVGRQKSEAVFGQKLINLSNSLNLRIKGIERGYDLQFKNLLKKSNSIINDALSQAKIAQTDARANQTEFKKIRQQIIKINAEISRLSAKNPDLSIEPIIRKLIANSPQIQSILTALKVSNAKIDVIQKYVLPALSKAIEVVGRKTQAIDGKVSNLKQNTDLKVSGVMLSGGLNNLKSRIITAEAALNDLTTRMQKRENVDKSALSKIDQMLGLLGPIPKY